MASKLKEKVYGFAASDIHGLSPVQNDQAGHRIAIVEDNDWDYTMLKHMLERSNLPVASLERFESIDELLQFDPEAFDVVVLDRYLPLSGLSETRIKEVRARFRNCGVLIHTGHITHSLRSAAAHQGAVAVVEKGSLDEKALALLVETAAVVGPTIHMPGEMH